MLLGGFAEVERGPFVFLEKDWGNMTSEGYSEHILPKVVDWIRTKSRDTDYDYLFIWNNASVHKAP